MTYTTVLELLLAPAWALLEECFFLVLFSFGYSCDTDTTRPPLSYRHGPTQLAAIRLRDITVIANDPSLSLDLTADVENGLAAPPSVQAAETKRWDKEVDVLDISMENAHPSPLLSPRSLPSRQLFPDPIEPYVPTPISQRTLPLRIHTDVPAKPLSRASPVNSLDRPSRSPIRPLPTLPTRPSMRRSRSAKTEEARGESPHSHMPRSVLSADDLRVCRRDSRRSRAHSIASMSGEVDECEIVQHHDGGVNARIEFPPPYHECLQVQAATSAFIQYLKP
ncbi:hypothetical protein BJV78DRAFT_217889 [Lactifluus subvellereus]|nr:hypothetical protein BJV78DRAFT_217889 [Lactifluus subvellereus]